MQAAKNVGAGLAFVTFCSGAWVHVIVALVHWMDK
jgi:hypothetical protein